MREINHPQQEKKGASPDMNQPGQYWLETRALNIPVPYPPPLVNEGFRPGGGTEDVLKQP